MSADPGTCAIFLSEADAVMLMALVTAAGGAAREEVPIGAVMRDGWGRIVAQAGNRSHGPAAWDPLGHAEIRALQRAAQRLGSERLPGTSLSVTLEPCPLCRLALTMARVEEVNYATGRDFGKDQYLMRGFSPHQVSRYAGAGASLLKKFFEMRR